MIHRAISEYLNKDASYYPVVTLTGPRQSGKTTLVKAVFSDHRYVSLEDQDNRIATNEDPRGFLARFDKDVIIEEAGELYPLEIKSAATMRPAMFETLNWWLQLASIPRERATLVYGGKDAYTYKDIRVQPWFSI